jgi:hypothetical protein
VVNGVDFSQQASISHSDSSDTRSRNSYVQFGKNLKFVLCQPHHQSHPDFMLKICQSPLPQTLLSYVAFRVAFRETCESYSLHKRCLSEQTVPYGYLCEVPFLQEVAPSVQLDLLASTWHKHLSREEYQADLVDESVVYAVCEMTSRLI